MKKLKFNSMLDHKQSDYKTREIIVEKVITLYGKSFSELKNHPLSDNQYIAQNRELMYIDSNDTAHCLLMVDYDSGNGILVESEGSSYARKSQFIPNARELIENNDLTASERKLHNSLKKIVDHIAELAHCGEKGFVFDELLEKSDLDFKSLFRDSVVTMLQEREDIQMAESHSMTRMKPPMGTTTLLQSVSIVDHMVVPPLAEPEKLAGCPVKNVEIRPPSSVVL